MNPLSIYWNQFKIYVFIAVAIALIVAFFFYRHSLIVDGELKVQAKTLEVTAKAEDKRKRELAKQAIADAAQIALVEKTYANALTSANALVDDLNSRLRAYANAGRGGLAHPSDPATSVGHDVAPGIAGSVEDAIEGVNRAASHDAEKVIGLQNYIIKECH